MATFVSQLTRDLSERVVVPVPGTPPSPAFGVSSASATKIALQALYLQLDHAACSPARVREYLDELQGLEQSRLQLRGQSAGEEEEAALRHAILGRLAVELYGQALDTFLREARDAEDEMEWWNDVERSRSNLALYLLQTLPSRLLNVLNTILSTLRTRNIPLQLSTFTPSSIRELFPSRNIFRPNTLTIALFPHLRAQPYHPPFSSLRPHSASRTAGAESALNACLATLEGFARSIAALCVLPLELTRAECKHKQQELARIRDDRAEHLGALAEMRASLAAALDADHHRAHALTGFAQELCAELQGGFEPKGAPSDGALDPLGPLHAVAHGALPTHGAGHDAGLAAQQLRRPGPLTLLWPRLVLLPPLALWGVRTAYAARASLRDVAQGAWEAARGFWEGWLLAPLRDVVHTVRAGGEDGVIITRESVKADLDSLERMALALVQEKLHYGAAELGALARQIEAGDLTPIMQIYEEDIRRPVASAVSGTLLRSLFIQVQKAKVDLNQALAGIDKLLRSQELTFAFVGVAPALALVYVGGGFLGTLWLGGRGRGRFGGRAKRASVWLKMRRIERLLIAQPRTHHGRHGVRTHGEGEGEGEERAIPALTAGLLLLSVSHLRAYAEAHLPADSRLREGFLEDVADLEEPALGRGEKLRVLDRMWRSWGEVLGWSRAGWEAGAR